MDAYETIESRVAEFIQFSKNRAILYACLYRSTRSVIIVLSTLTAVSAKYSTSGFVALHGATPWMALAVAILASFEAWLKPGKIYREHYRYNDLYIAAETQLALIEPGDKVQLSTFAKELAALDKQYRASVED